MQSEESFNSTLISNPVILTYMLIYRNKPNLNISTKIKSCKLAGIYYTAWLQIFVAENFRI